MAAPIASMIQLPSDSNNTGKKVRSQTRVVGPDTVHEHFFILTSERNYLGKYSCSSGVLTVPTAVHNGTTTGFIWLCNPVGSVVKLAIRKVVAISQFTALAVDLLPGELSYSLFTFTGVGSAGLLTPAKRKSTDATAVGNMRTASTSMACTLGAKINSSQYQTMDLVTGGAGHWNPSIDPWIIDTEDDETILLAGEGIVMWHSVAVTTANRRLLINAYWGEFEA